MSDTPQRKVTFVLEELGLSYESKYLDFGKQEQKSAEYTQYNPNGRIPALIDHGNNDFVVWCVLRSPEPPHEGLLTDNQGVQRDYVVPC